MNNTINPTQVRKTLQAVMATTQNRTVKDLMARAIVLLDQEGYGTAAAYLAHRSQKSRWAQHLWQRVFCAGLAVLCTILWGAVIIIMVKSLRPFIGGL
jgi:hypothetical protein